jgi:hypothetical protein
MTRQEEAEAMVDGSHPVDDLNDIVGKFIRDFMVNLAIAIPIYATNGEVNLEVLAPALCTCVGASHNRGVHRQRAYHLREALPSYDQR